MPDVNEVYLLPSRGSPRCIVCHPSAEALVDGLREGAFALCPQHLLRAHVHGNEEDGVPSLRYMGKIPTLCPRCGTACDPDVPICERCGYDRVLADPPPPSPRTIGKGI
jgi:hypothetical protein